MSQKYNAALGAYELISKNNGPIVLKVEPKDFSKLYRGTITVYAGGPNGRKAETRVHAFVQP